MHGGLKFSVYDVVTLTNEQFGWDEKPFLMKWSTGVGDKLSPISLVLQDENSASYGWNNGEATTVDPAPNTNLSDPSTVLPAGALKATESLYVTRDSAGVKTQVTMRWGASADSLLRDYLPEYKLRADEVWTTLHPTVGTEAVIKDMAPTLAGVG